MIAEIGRFFFRLALSATIVSFIVVTVLSAYDLPVPDILVRYSGILGLITGKVDLHTLLNLGTNIAVGVGAWALINIVSSIIGAGKLNVMQALSLKAKAVYLALWMPVADGVSIITASFGQLVALIMPGASAASVIALTAALDSFIKFTVLYYLAVRVFGLPAE